MENKKEFNKKIIHHTYHFNILELIQMVKDNEIVFNNLTETNNKWTNLQKSYFIESILLNLPIPDLIFIHTVGLLKYEVIDGQQRLLTLQEFLENKLILKNLKIRNDINDKVYKELPKTDREFLRKNTIRCIVVLPAIGDELKNIIIKRLN